MIHFELSFVCAGGKAYTDPELSDTDRQICRNFFKFVLCLAYTNICGQVAFLSISHEIYLNLFYIMVSFLVTRVP